MFDGVRKFFEDPMGAIAGLFERLFELIMEPFKGLSWWLFYVWRAHVERARWSEVYRFR